MIRTVAALWLQCSNSYYTTGNICYASTTYLHVFRWMIPAATVYVDVLCHLSGRNKTLNQRLYSTSS